MGVPCRDIGVNGAWQDDYADAPICRGGDLGMVSPEEIAVGPGRGEDAAGSQSAGEPRVEGREPGVDLRCQAGRRLNARGQCRPDAPVPLVAADGGRGARSGPVPVAWLSRCAWFGHVCPPRPDRRSSRPASTSSRPSLDGGCVPRGDSSVRGGADAGGAPGCGAGPRPACLRDLSHRVDARPIARSGRPGLVRRAGAISGSLFGSRGGSSRGGAAASGDRAACQRPLRAASGRRWGAAALLAAAGLLAVTPPAMAQDNQLSNITTTTADDVWELDTPFATFFTASGSLKHLHSVDIEIATVAPSTTRKPLSVQIWRATSAGVPLERIAWLETPSTVVVGINTFNAPLYVPLAADNTYAVVVDRWDDGELKTTTDTNQDDETSSLTLGNQSWSSSQESIYASSTQDWGSAGPVFMRFRVKARNRNAGTGLSTAESLSALTLRDPHDNATVALSPAFLSSTRHYTASVGSNVSRISLMGTSTNGLGRVGRQGTETLYRVLKYRAPSGGEYKTLEPCEEGSGYSYHCPELVFSLQQGRSTTFIVDVGQEIRDDDGNVTKDIDHADTQKNSYTLVVTRRAPLSAAFQNVPDSHDGSTPFTVRVGFEDDLDSDSQTRLASAISVTNGSVTTAPTSVGGSKFLYTVGITPSSAAPVRISLRGSRNCTSAHSLCNETGLHMGSGPSVTVSVATDARLESLVLSSPLLEPGTEQFEWSQAFESDTYVYEVGSPITRSLRVNATANSVGATITFNGKGVVTPSGFTGTAASDWTVAMAGGTLTVTVTSSSDTNPVTQTYTVEVTKDPGGLHVVAANAYERPGAELLFPVRLNPAKLRKVTVNYATFDGSAKAGAGQDYEATSGKLTFEPGDTLMHVTVPVHDDDNDEGME